MSATTDNVNIVGPFFVDANPPPGSLYFLLKHRLKNQTMVCGSDAKHYFMWLTIVSITINGMAGVSCLWVALSNVSRPRCRPSPPWTPLPPSFASTRIYRAMDMLISQAVALYSLALLLWLPLIQDGFLPPAERTVQYLAPAVCVAVGRHVFFCFLDICGERSSAPSSSHFFSAVCHLLFLQTGTLLVLAALSLTTEIGNIFNYTMALVGLRRAGHFPSWVAGLGVMMSIMFHGMLYLTVLGLLWIKRSPMIMPPLALTLFFFYVTYSFIMNTYAICLVMKSFFSSLQKSRHRWAAAQTADVDTVVLTQTLTNNVAALQMSSALSVTPVLRSGQCDRRQEVGECEEEVRVRSDNGCKCSLHALTLKSIV